MRGKMNPLKTKKERILQKRNIWGIKNKLLEIKNITVEVESWKLR